MIDRVRAALARIGGLTPGCRVTVALSGGADSVALLHLLRRLSSAPEAGDIPFALAAAHLNHGLRGAEADRDEAFVRQLCERWNVPLTVGRADVPALCRETGEGTETAARRVRYAFLEQTAGDGLLATAHTRTDNAETFVLHLLRGSGLAGLAGIPAVRGRILRPLIDCTRAEVEAYCRAQGLAYVTDSTNLTDGTARNRVRHRLLPVLEELEPAAQRQMARTMALLRQDEAYLSEQAARWAEGHRLSDGSLPVAALRDLPAALQSRVLLAFARAHASADRVEQRHVDALAALLIAGGAVTLPGGTVIGCREDLLTSLPPPAVFPAGEEIPFSLGEHRLPGGSYRLRTVDLPPGEEGAKVYNLLLNHSVDYDTISEQTVLRTRRAGDAITLPRRPRKTLKKLFNENRLPPRDRAVRLVLADAQGVMFVEGFGPDRRCAPGPRTRRLLLIEKTED